MTKRQSKSQPTWTDVKTKLASFDQKGLLSLIGDLYAAQVDNQTFLHARLGLGEDPLRPYKETVDRWISPDVFRKQDTSVAKAKQAISNYKKAVGETAGLAELMVFFCERAAGFCEEYGNDDVGYYNALLNMFGQALALADTLPAPDRNSLIARLDRVSDISQAFGYGVADEMGFLLAQFPTD